MQAPHIQTPKHHIPCHAHHSNQFPLWFRFFFIIFSMEIKENLTVFFSFMLIVWCRQCSSLLDRICYLDRTLLLISFRCEFDVFIQYWTLFHSKSSAFWNFFLLNTLFYVFLLFLVPCFFLSFQDTDECYQKKKLFQMICFVFSLVGV